MLTHKAILYILVGLLILGCIFLLNNPEINLKEECRSDYIKNNIKQIGSETQPVISDEQVSALQDKLKREGRC